MRGKKFSVGLIAVLTLSIVILLVTGTCAVAQERVLGSFDTRDGAEPEAGLIFDAAGNLYGTTYAGGGHSRGTIFELKPQAGGGWVRKVLHIFNSNGTDGYNPRASLTLDASGNIYGTTYLGGTYGFGIAFELAPQADGSSIYTVLYAFGSGKDGQYPVAGLIFDSSGNLYGTTGKGGVYNFGTVFELSPQASPGWKETVLYNFGKAAKDGEYPQAGLIFDPAGNLYSTTSQGGMYYRGTVFELMPDAGRWTEKILHSFSPSEGIIPDAGLVRDAAGNLYGTTYSGGDRGCGTVFEMTPTANQGWTEMVLHGFSAGPTDGCNPSGLVFDMAGNLYGTTSDGGVYGFGTVFEMTNTAGGWIKKALHNFGSGNSMDGRYPATGLVSGATGNLYSTTYAGGAYDEGTVFEITP
jgi:uncharacterized repeat protein (TIGR03803 family)